MNCAVSEEFHCCLEPLNGFCRMEKPEWDDGCEGWVMVEAFDKEMYCYLFIFDSHIAGGQHFPAYYEAGTNGFLGGFKESDKGVF